MDAYKKFTHKTPHLKGKQHQLDPNIDLKQLVHHATVQYVDRDADGDVDVYDNPKKKTPDENPIKDFGTASKKLIAKQKGEIKHTKRGMAYEEVEEKRYCPMCDKRETRSECSYGGKAWDKVSVKDHEYSMARSELSTVMNAVKRLQKKMGKGEGNVEAWVQSKITKAADYLDTAADYVASGEMEEACWVGYKQEGLKKKGKRMVPNCVPTNEAKTLGFEIKKSSGAGALTPDAAKQLGDKAVALQKKKAAAVALPKLKEHRGIVAKILEELQKEDVTIEDANGNTFAEVVDVIKPEPIKGFKQQVDEATRLPATTGNIISVMLNWRGKTYGTKMFFPQTKLPTRKDVEYEIQKVYPDCRILTYKVAEFVPGQALIYVDNTKSKNYLMNNKTIGEETIEEVAAWQRKEGKNPEGGLNAKGRASAKAQGHNLKPPVTTPPSKLDPDSKPAKRRKSFCARMGGMPGPMKDEKGRPTRKALSLRKWNC